MSSPAQDTTPPYDMGELLDSMKPIKPLRRGDVVEGVVMRADSDGIFVNVGAKAEGVVPPGEMRTLEPGALEQLSVGDEIVTFVVRAETGDDAAILSIDRAVGEHGWRVLETALESGTMVEGKILGFNRGGAIVEAEGVQGFVPISQLVSVSRSHFRDTQRPKEAPEPPAAVAAPPAQVTDTEQEGDQAAATPQATEPEQQAGEAEAAPQIAEPEEQAGEAEAASQTTEPEQQAGETQAAPQTTEPEQQAGEAEAPAQAEPGADQKGEEQPDPRAADIGKLLQLKVLEVNRARNRAIFSERQAVQAMRDEQKARLIKELTEGETRTGRVTGISSFGAFVDLGGADGLIHISELSWEQVSSPEQVVKVGDELDVFVLRVDAENKRIALSLRRLQPEPWQTINERYLVDDIVDATVTKLTNFGAFARVEGSVEGLIHISELTTRMINHPREVVREGAAVRVKILRIEPERRRLGLSLRQAMEDEGVEESVYMAELTKEPEGVAQEVEGVAQEPEDATEEVAEEPEDGAEEAEDVAEDVEEVAQETEEVAEEPKGRDRGSGGGT